MRLTLFDLSCVAGVCRTSGCPSGNERFEGYTKGTKAPLMPQERAVLGYASNLASCREVSFRTLTFIEHLLGTALSAVNALTQNSKQPSGSHTHFCPRLLTSVALCAQHIVPRSPLAGLTLSLVRPPCSSLASSHMLLLCHQDFRYGKLFCLKSSWFIHLSSSKAQKHRRQEESPLWSQPFP